ncbi:MAG: hydrogenase nickel incorporation protein HypB [Vicinamibacterales bacterium]
MERVNVEKKVLKENDRIAAEIRAELERRGILSFNIIASPGAGKTSLLERTLERLTGGPLQVAVLTGDIQTERDARRLARFGFPARQIVTGGTCHLDASMVQRALEEIPLDGLHLLFIENVGNLVCPAAYDLGEQSKIVMLSVTEGDDKPLKYPSIFSRARLLVLHKIDLLPHTPFDVEAAKADARRVNPGIEIVETSVVGPPGLDAWLEWLQARVAERT